VRNSSQVGYRTVGSTTAMLGYVTEGRVYEREAVTGKILSVKYIQICIVYQT